MLYDDGAIGSIEGHLFISFKTTTDIESLKQQIECYVANNRSSSLRPSRILQSFKIQATKQKNQYRLITDNRYIIDVIKSNEQQFNINITSFTSLQPDLSSSTQAEIIAASKDLYIEKPPSHNTPQNIIQLNQQATNALMAFGTALKSPQLYLLGFTQGTRFTSEHKWLLEQHQKITNSNLDLEQKLKSFIAHLNATRILKLELVEFIQKANDILKNYGEIRVANLSSSFYQDK